MTNKSSIADTQVQDLPRVSAFLHANSNSRIPQFEVPCLRWKYFDEFALARGPCSVIAQADDQIVSHIGLWQTDFHLDSRRVSACHFIDWMGDPAHPFVNLSVMRSRFGLSDVQYSIGGSDVAQAILPRLGFRATFELPVYVWEARPGFERGNLRSAYRSINQMGRWLAKRALSLPKQDRHRLSIRHREQINLDWDSDTQATRKATVFSDRSPGRLDYFLRCPIAETAAFEIFDAHTHVGFALVATMRGARPVAKIVECQLRSLDPAMWQSAIVALRARLVDCGATSVSIMATTPWIQRGTQDAGFRLQGHRTLFVRDPKGILPKEAKFYFSFLDADLGYRP